jgi:hypothetical protein
MKKFRFTEKFVTSWSRWSWRSPELRSLGNGQHQDRAGINPGYGRVVAIVLAVAAVVLKAFQRPSELLKRNSGGSGENDWIAKRRSN